MGPLTGPGAQKVQAAVQSCGWVIPFGRLSGAGSVSSGKGKRCGMGLMESPGDPEAGCTIRDRGLHTFEK